MKNKFNSILDEVKKFTLASEKENFILSQFDDAAKNEDTLLLEQLSKLVVGFDVARFENDFCKSFSIRFRADCLYFLTNLSVSRYIEAEENNADDERLEELFYEIYNCLWYFKWLVYKLPEDISFTLDEIKEYSEMMRMHYENAGLSLSMVYKTLMLQNMKMGYIDQAKENFHLWQVTEGDDSSDCEACEQTELVNYHHFIGEYQKAVELAEPILSGEMSCAEVPHITYYPAIDSLIQLGDWERAKSLLPEAVKLITVDSDFIYLLSNMIKLYVKLGEYEVAQKLANDYEQKILSRGEKDLLLQFEYFVATAKFSQENRDEAARLASLFDERNGNNYYMNQLMSVISENNVH